MARRRRKTTHHEAAHAVAHYFCRLSGKTKSVTIASDLLGEYNASKHPSNEASGLHTHSRTLPSIVGHSVDREQLHHQMIALLAGHAAGWVYGGESPRAAERDRDAEEEARQHADGSDDYSRAFQLLFDADPFESRVEIKRALEGDRGGELVEVRLRRHVERASDVHITQILETFEARWREAHAFVVEKWPHIQAVADALWKKRTLSREEVTEIIERVEDRIRHIPPSVEAALGSLSADAGISVQQ